jgi:iron complex transport system substrate-binding protein
MSDIAQKAGSLSTHPTVACVEWIDPLMAGGNWMPELIRSWLEGINLFGEAGKHSPWMTWDELESADPDIILVTPCGFDIDRTLEEMHLLSSKPGWANLKAVKAGRIIVADGNQYFNRPGPRLLESLEILAEVFHSRTFDFRHENRGWVRYGVTEPARAR